MDRHASRAGASGSKPKGLLSAQLPSAFEQRHQLIREPLAADDFQALTPSVATAQPEVKDMAAIAARLAELGRVVGRTGSSPAGGSLSRASP